MVSNSKNNEDYDLFQNLYNRNSSMVRTQSKVRLNRNDSED